MTEKRDEWEGVDIRSTERLRKKGNGRKGWKKNLKKREAKYWRKILFNIASRDLFSCARDSFKQWKCFVFGKEENKHDCYISPSVFQNSEVIVVFWKTFQLDGSDQALPLTSQVTATQVIYCLCAYNSSCIRCMAVYWRISKVQKFQQSNSKTVLYI